MMRAVAIPAGLLAGLLAMPAAAQSGDRMDGWARRGATYRVVPMDGGTPQACDALCRGDSQCRSWVWTLPGLDGPDAQCALLSATPTPYRAPGRVTGLSDALARHIEAAAERPPSAREIEALRATASAGPG
ncbi:MAG: PAN domain-containing protein [Pseudomonadota bacterium]|nr:PAN domain-containing protein [Pseudomonadota bacterium]